MPTQTHTISRMTIYIMYRTGYRVISDIKKTSYIPAQRWSPSQYDQCALLLCLPQDLGAGFAYPDRIVPASIGHRLLVGGAHVTEPLPTRPAVVLGGVTMVAGAKLYFALVAVHDRSVGLPVSRPSRLHHHFLGILKHTGCQAHGRLHHLSHVPSRHAFPPVTRYCTIISATPPTTTTTTTNLCRLIRFCWQSFCCRFFGSDRFLRLVGTVSYIMRGIFLGNFVCRPVTVCLLTMDRVCHLFLLSGEAHAADTYRYTSPSPPRDRHALRRALVTESLATSPTVVLGHGEAKLFPAATTILRMFVIEGREMERRKKGAGGSGGKMKRGRR